MNGFRPLLVEDEEEGEQTGHVLGECIVANLALGNGTLFGQQLFAQVSFGSKLCGGTDHFGEGPERFADKLREGLISLRLSID